MKIRVRWIVLAICVCANVALAEDPDELFREGRALMDQGDVVAACGKFEQSLAIAPALGTRLNLAVCDEKRGRLASALRGFQESETQASAQDLPDFVRLARERIGALTSRVPTLTVMGESQPEQRVVMVRPGFADVPLQLGEATIVDPTDPNDANDIITILVYTPGFETASATAPTILEATKSVLQLPPLVRAPQKAAKAPGTWKKPTGLVLAGTGVAVLATSVVLNLDWRSSANESTCISDPDCVEEFNSKMRVTGTTLFVLGAAMTGAGAYFYFTAPKTARPADRRVAVVPAWDGSAFGLIATGQF